MAGTAGLGSTRGLGRTGGLGRGLPFSGLPAASPAPPEAQGNGGCKDWGWEAMAKPELTLSRLSVQSAPAPQPPHGRDGGWRGAGRDPQARFGVAARLP